MVKDQHNPEQMPFLWRWLAVEFQTRGAVLGDTTLLCRWCLSGPDPLTCGNLLILAGVPQRDASPYLPANAVV